MGPWAAWWALYLGRVGALIGAVYPSGRAGGEALALEAKWGVTGKGNELLVLEVRTTEGGDAEGEVFTGEVQQIGKAGKKKNWIGGRDGYGHRVEVR